MSELTKRITQDLSPGEKLCEIHNVVLQNTGGEYNLSYCKMCCEENQAKYDDMQREVQLHKKQGTFEEMLAAACIPKRFMGSSLENFLAVTSEQKRVLDNAREFANSDDFTGAIFTGLRGTGKTHLATAIGIEFLKRGKSCLYTKLFNMILSIKESWKSKDVSESDVINHYTTKDLLIVDEVGVQFGTSTELLYISNIIDDRYNNLLPTILIGNVTPEELSRFVGDRVVRRVRERCKTLVFSWKPNPFSATIAV